MRWREPVTAFSSPRYIYDLDTDNPTILAMSVMDRFRVCFEESIQKLSGCTLDLSRYATECRYRLIDCSQFVDHDTLRILETPHSATFIHTDFSTISYIWRGLPVREERNDAGVGVFLVKGAENGGKVSIDVLQHACKASLLLGAPYIWLDRLCIIQTKRYDKSWQISQMYHIYKASKVSIILPGGIQRLVDLDEETK
ncbi:hypothetical protein OBBRIDRAFT_160699 [Obba rivulosa]|uniref:Heterokaryon incompatibility domain-containing protein n=1 Tax=Obba rivulosa TaxID=1052685 RepID=A0A8E2AMP3_9APHY|nr:hypothetical protein OBBRIDRAFT_160699 [Obba rivulosa]